MSRTTATVTEKQQYALVALVAGLTNLQRAGLETKVPGAIDALDDLIDAIETAFNQRNRKTVVLMRPDYMCDQNDAASSVCVIFALGDTTIEAGDAARRLAHESDGSVADDPDDYRVIVALDGWHDWQIWY